MRFHRQRAWYSARHTPITITPPTRPPLGRILTSSVSWIAPSTSYPSLAAAKSFLSLLGIKLSGLIFFLSGNFTQSETVVGESSSQKMKN